MKITKGWRIFSSDFSIEGRDGSATLQRDAENTKLWHTLDDNGQDNNSLYVYGSGETIEDAIFNANEAAKAAGEIVIEIEREE